MNKKIKSILLIVLVTACVILFAAFGFCGLNYVVFAEESTETVEELTEPVETTEDTGATETTEETATFLGRVWEWLSSNYAEVISTAGTVLAAAIAIIVPLFNKKSKSSIDATELKLITKQSDTVDAVNTLIESYNTLMEKYTEVEQELEEYNSEETEKYKAIGSLITQTKTILEILTTVYANSKNLPQGVKDIINLKYAAALKTESDDEALIEVVQEAEQEAEEETGAETAESGV
ncbi:MAG: hypothetical protein LUD19_06545 [Clostridia bacterium]|nr:hypothetical protein [Clostridia bacterium]